MQNTAKSVSRHILSDEGASNIEVAVLTELMHTYVPSMQQFNGLDAALLQASTGVDAALFVVRTPT